MIRSVLVTLLLAPAAEPPKGFTPLFDGKGLAGWHGQAPFDPARLAELSDTERKARLDAWAADARSRWKADAGALVGAGGVVGLATDRDFGDVELLFEMKAEQSAGAAVWLRGSPLPLDLRKRTGEWEQVRVLQVGERTTVTIDGKPLLDHARLSNRWDGVKPLPRTGPIQLQAPGGVASWRNVFVRALGADEANDVLRTRGADGFESVFNGKDFAGWAGPLDNYEVKDGAIVCRPKKGGNIHTEAEYADFTVRVEYRLPPGGNNGLALRYPGKGQASVDALCEVQVLDDDAPQYAKLDARQYNGSAYGMVAAQRGYLRPTGEWNFMEATARGSTVRIELNGTLILDADLAKVTDFMGGKPHPGRERTTGHFGLCGHNDPVAFRNVRIKRLGGGS